MSIMQDFEKARKTIGAKKYDAIEEYIEEVCPKSSYENIIKNLTA